VCSVRAAGSGLGEAEHIMNCTASGDQHQLRERGIGQP